MPDNPTQPNPDVNSWTYCCGPVNPGDTFFITSIDVPLLAWDLNNDGRFTAADIRAITQALQVCTAQTTLECLGAAFDVNADGEIDQLDFDILFDLLACGVDTGLFGDANQDGVIDCDDLAAATIFPLIGIGATPPSIPIGHPNYIFELDQNLDGVIDFSDQAAFYALFQHCP